MSVKYFDKEQNKWMIFPGTIGAKGKDSYEVAVDHGYKGTYEEYEEMITKMPELFTKAEDFIENIDEYPTQDSDRFVKSGGVFSHVDSLKDAVNTSISDKYTELRGDIDKAKEELGEDIVKLQENMNNVIDDQISNINKSLSDLEASLNELNDTLSGEISDKVSKEDFEISAKDFTDAIAAGDQSLIDRLTGKGDPIEIVGTCITDGAITTEHLAANFMYTKDLTAEQVSAINIDASQITTGTINADRLNLSDYLTIGDAEDTYFTNNAAQNLTLSADKIVGGEVKGLTIKSNDNDSPAWMLDKNGSGRLANGNISWKENGDVSFGSNVTLSWSNITDKSSIENDVNKAKQDAAEAKSSLNNKADKSDIPDVSGFITSDVIDGINERIDNIDVTISAADVVGALQNSDSQTISDIINGKVKIKGTAIADGAITTEKIAANAIGANQIATNYVYAGSINASQINTGKITASQIDATDLKVKAANITDKLTASQIDATNLTVKAANIDGKLNASQVVLTDYATKTDVNNLKITSDKIEGGSLSGLTISSGNGAWELSKDGSGYFSNNAISWNALGEAIFDGNISIGTGIKFYSGNMTFNLSPGSIKIETINSSKIAGIELKNGQLYIRNDSGQYYSTGGYYKPIDVYICDVVKAEYNANNGPLDTQYIIEYEIDGIEDEYPRENLLLNPVVTKKTTPIYRELKNGEIIETKGETSSSLLRYTAKTVVDPGYYTMSTKQTDYVMISTTGNITISPTPLGSPSGPNVPEAIAISITFKFDDGSSTTKSIHFGVR